MPVNTKFERGEYYRIYIDTMITFARIHVQTFHLLYRIFLVAVSRVLHNMGEKTHN